MKSENLWWKWVRDYLRDPQTVFSSMASDDLMRRLFKGLWLVLSIYILFWVAGPTQVNSWRLWMEDADLAWHTAWGLTLASALGFAIVRYAYQGTPKMRLPFGVEIVPPTVVLGAVLVVGLFAFSLMGIWNYYLHEQQSRNGVAAAAISGNSSSVAVAERALTAFEIRAKQSLDIVDNAIKETSAGSPTGRSRLVNRRQETEAAQATERRQLQADLKTAQGETVEVRAVNTDKRPADAVLASATGTSRDFMGSLTDLGRSGIIEMLLFLGAGLGLVGATSQLGVKQVRVSHETELPEELSDEPVEEELEETEPAPMDAPPPPPPRRRFTLPEAIPADIDAAVAVGPAQRRHDPPPVPNQPETTEAAPEAPESAVEGATISGVADEAPAADPPEPATETVEEIDEPVDPLVEELAVRREEEAV